MTSVARCSASPSRRCPLFSSLALDNRAPARSRGATSCGSVRSRRRPSASDRLPRKTSSKPRARAKPSVIWLHFQECTGCTESLLRTSHPGIDELILDLISLDYHETLFAAAGHQAEAALQGGDARRTPASTSASSRAPSRRRTDGIYCKIGGRTALDILNDVARKAGAVIAIGSCASWGGIPVGRSQSDRRHRRARDPQGQDRSSTCRAARRIPYNLLGAVLQYATSARCPKLDDARPSEVRLRPDHSRALSAARAFRRRPFRGEVRRRGPSPGILPLQARMQGAGDARELLDARTSAKSSTAGRSASAIRASAAPSKNIALHGCRCTQTVQIDRPIPPDTYPPINAEQGGISPVATACGRRDRRRPRRRAGTSRRRSSRRPAERRAPAGAESRGVAMGISRRAALKTMIAARCGGGGHRRPSGRRRPSCRRRRPTPSACSTTPRSCIGCKACVVACQDANGLPRDTSGIDATYDAPDRSQRSARRTSSSSTRTTTANRS